MRAFHMNLLTYNANTQFPAGGVATQKQQNLSQEMMNYRNNVIGGAGVNLAGFTEVLVANNALQANVQNALNDLGTGLGIPPGANGRHIAVIRCGRTALQNSNEVVAIVVDGTANINTFGLLYFTQPNPIQWINNPIPAAANRYTSHLQIPAGAIPDYRYIVYVDFTWNGQRYTVGFIHNRAPGYEQALLVMQGIRNLLETGQPVNLTMSGGDFNVQSSAIGPGGQGVQYPPTGHHRFWYYSPGNTTVVNAYDYWISHVQLMSPGGGTAISNSTPTAPAPAITGSDHRGVGIEI